MSRGWSGVFGLRLFFHPRSRQRIVIFAATLSVAGFAVRAVVQAANLGGTSLQYDYKPYYDAATALNHGADPYSVFLNTCTAAWCNVGYIYPPLFAELFRPLALLPPHTGALIWLLMNDVFLVAAVLVVNRALDQWLTPTVKAGLLLASLVFLPVYTSFYFLQVNVLVLLLLALAAWAYTSGRAAAAGVVLGFAGVLRVTPLIQAPALLRSRRDLLRPTGLVGLGLSVVVIMGLLALMTSTTIEYVTTVLPRLGVSTAILDNVSLPGLLLRVQGFYTSLPMPAVKAVSLALQVGLLVATWLSGLRLEGGRQRAAVFAAFLAVTPIISSITWDHHLVTELLVFALLAPSLSAGSRAWWLAAVSYPLLWVPRQFTDPLATGLGLAFPHGLAVMPFLLVTGLNLVGMVLLWLACLDVLRGYRAAIREPATL